MLLLLTLYNISFNVIYCQVVGVTGEQENYVLNYHEYKESENISECEAWRIAAKYLRKHTRYLEIFTGMFISPCLILSLKLTCIPILTTRNNSTIVYSISVCYYTEP